MADVAAPTRRARTARRGPRAAPRARRRARTRRVPRRAQRARRRGDVRRPRCERAGSGAGASSPARVGRQRASSLRDERGDQLAFGAAPTGPPPRGGAAGRARRALWSWIAGCQGGDSLRPQGLVRYRPGEVDGPALIARTTRIDRNERAARRGGDGAALSRRRGSARRSPRTAPAPSPPPAAARRWSRCPPARRSAVGRRGAAARVVAAASVVPVPEVPTSAVPSRRSCRCRRRRAGPSALVGRSRRRCSCCRRRSSVSLGTVSAGGAPGTSSARDLAAAAAGGERARATARTARARSARRAAHGDAGQRGSAAMRRPQCGQSLRSFCASWSHQLQKRRFSTDHGSDGLRRRQRQHLADDLHRLAGLAVAVGLARLGGQQDLAAGGRRAQAVQLARAHRRQPSNGPGTYAYARACAS